MSRPALMANELNDSEFWLISMYRHCAPRQQEELQRLAERLSMHPDPQPGEWRIDPRTSIAYEVVSIGPDPDPWVRMQRRNADGQMAGRHAPVTEVRLWELGEAP